MVPKMMRIRRRSVFRRACRKAMDSVLWVIIILQAEWTANRTFVDVDPKKKRTRRCASTIVEKRTIPGRMPKS